MAIPFTSQSRCWPGAACQLFFSNLCIFLLLQHVLDDMGAPIISRAASISSTAFEL